MNDPENFGTEYAGECLPSFQNPIDVKQIILLLLALSAIIKLPAQDDFKVIGYLPYYRFAYNSQIEYERLTHLNIAFANPDMEGDLDVGGQNIAPVVAAAKANGVKVFISLAGGALTEEWSQAWEHHMLPENSPSFIHKVMEYLDFYQLEGVDFDLEWGDVNEKYSPFVLQLRDSLTAHGLELTAALPATHRYPDITDEALAAFDWINMMAYDLTGPWNPSNAGPHSPYSFALGAMFYWEGQGVSKANLTLGVPFYGYDFGSNPVTAHRYATIVGWDPNNAQYDQVDDVYYNGIPTIIQKTELALDHLSGIMIWELGQDDFSDLSLLRAIDETVNGVTKVEIADLQNLSVYPNPFVESITVNNNTDGALRYWLSDLNGQVLRQERLLAQGEVQVNVSELPQGFYLLTAQNEQERRTYKLVKSR